MSATTIETKLDARNLRIAIVAARFNAFCVDRLLEGALLALKQQGALDSNIVVARVPGAFDIPVVARRFAMSGQVDAVITLGAVIRGATPHFDYVCNECAAGITRASLDSGVPIAFGVLTTDNEAQAMERAGVQVDTSVANAPTAHVDTLTGNKGADAALCAIEMANLMRAIDSRYAGAVK
jgi:6,7-dimethyl-8-ribityllumazine synthase